LEATVNLELSRYLGCLLGGAVGDALGASVEFSSRKEILRCHGEQGLVDYAPAYGRIGAITDDTQMTLFTAEGLLRGYVRYRMRGIGPVYGSTVSNAYMRWLHTQGHSDPHGAADLSGWLIGQGDLHYIRAPGATCLSALQSMQHPGGLAQNDSKGCGGIMRVAPVGLFMARIYGVSEQTQSLTFDLAVEIAGLTHGHPTGQLSAGFLAVVIALLAQGVTLTAAIQSARDILIQKDNHQETLDAILTAADLAKDSPNDPEKIKQLGEGWVAEEALAISLYCALSTTQFDKAVLLAVNHDGDSDSTGAITGNLMGVIGGSKVIPEHWIANLELKDVIEQIAIDLYEAPTWSFGGPLGDEVANSLWERYPGN